MSTPLNLVDHLLTSGRNFQKLGRNHDAFQVFNRLASFRNLAPEVNEEALRRLTEILLDEGRYVKARRHLTALLVQCPNSAHYHYLMATALDADERADPHRAAEHYRKSLKLEPNDPRCMGEFGLLLLRLGQVDEGLAYLRRAVEIAPNDPEAVARLADGLRQEGFDDKVRETLRVALFRNPRDARFRRLWDDHQFRALHDEQQRQRVDAPLTPAADRHILAFVRAASPEGTPVVRRDPPSVPQPPHVPQSGRVPGKKHA